MKIFRLLNLYFSKSQIPTDNLLNKGIQKESQVIRYLLTTAIVTPFVLYGYFQYGPYGKENLENTTSGLPTHKKIQKIQLTVRNLSDGNIPVAQTKRR